VNSIARAHGKLFREIRPATSLVEISRMIAPEMLVEIQAESIVADGRYSTQAN
jgi:hypothetical protein